MDKKFFEALYNFLETNGYKIIGQIVLEGPNKLPYLVYKDHVVKEICPWQFETIYKKPSRLPPKVKQFFENLRRTNEVAPGIKIEDIKYTVTNIFTIDGKQYNYNDSTVVDIEQKVVFKFNEVGELI